MCMIAYVPVIAKGDTDVNVMDLITARLAAPKKFRVSTRYQDGRIKAHDVETIGQAENFAVGQRSKIGKNLIDRDTGKTVRVVSVEITAL